MIPIRIQIRIQIIALGIPFHTECKLSVTTYIIIHILTYYRHAFSHKIGQTPPAVISSGKHFFYISTVFGEPFPKINNTLPERHIYIALSNKPFGVLVIRLDLQRLTEIFKRPLIITKKIEGISHSEIPVGSLSAVTLCLNKQR